MHIAFYVSGKNEFGSVGGYFFNAAEAVEQYEKEARIYPDAKLVLEVRANASDEKPMQTHIIFTLELASQAS